MVRPAFAPLLGCAIRQERGITTLPTAKEEPRTVERQAAGCTTPTGAGRISSNRMAAAVEQWLADQPEASAAV